METFAVTDFERLAPALRRPFTKNYFAMYSSVYGGIVTDPALMLIPIDDHMVHRGDGLFETFKSVNGAIYNLHAHVERLIHGATSIGLKLPIQEDELTRLSVETVRAGGHRDAAVRLFISRGSGSLDVNPYDCPEGGVFVIAYRLNPPFMLREPAGAVVRTSTVPTKPPFTARVKSVNYIHNMLMKRQAVDWGVHFVLGYDADGHMTEGATENFGIVTRDGEMLFPRLDGILAGTTMLRVIELAHTLVTSGTLRRVAYEDISAAAAHSASEMLVVGTTLDVVAVREYDGKPVGTGKPGPIHASLSAMLAEDIRSNKDLLTPVF
jgi:branched-chain amino acid aminotransferase